MHNTVTERRIINFPTEEEEQAMMDKFMTKMREQNKEMSAACRLAGPAMLRLCDVMQHKTGQSHHLRALLHSLWSNVPTGLTAVVHFDWEIRKDLLAVMLAFGGQDFFYDEVKAAVTAAGLWDWFTEESEVGK